ncbi:MAG: hydantoinase B/oxoprolinase family protein, partial [Gaiellales bacterium]
TDDAWSVSGLLDRTQHPAPGLAGGLAGATGAYRLAGGADLPIKRVVPLRPGDAVELQLPGGGGYGLPSARDPQAVLSDVVEGYVSIEQARALYGVSVRYTGPEGALVRPRSSYELA